jgi:hypothetical protein
VRAQMKKLLAIGRQLAVAPDQQVSLTDPDTRSMATSGRGTETAASTSTTSGTTRSVTSTAGLRRSAPLESSGLVVRC